MPIEHVQLPVIHHRIAMVRLMRAIDQARSLGELLPLVVTLLQETDALMNGRKLSESAIQRIVVPLAKIRSLLTTLANTGCGSNLFSRENVLARELVDRYTNIEGQLKEMRNDRVRARNSAIP